MKIAFLILSLPLFLLAAKPKYNLQDYFFSRNENPKEEVAKTESETQEVATAPEVKESQEDSSKNE